MGDFHGSFSAMTPMTIVGEEPESKIWYSTHRSLPVLCLARGIPSTRKKLVLGDPQPVNDLLLEHGDFQY